MTANKGKTVPPCTSRCPFAPSETTTLPSTRVSEYSDPMDIFAKLRELNLPREEYVVIGSGILGALSIRNTGDLDLLVSPALFEQLRERGWKQEMVTYDGRPREKLESGDTEVFKDFWYGGNTVDTAHMIAGATIIENFPFLPLEKLREIKVAFNREKDHRDIALIDRYLNAHERTPDAS